MFRFKYGILFGLLVLIFLGGVFVHNHGAQILRSHGINSSFVDDALPAGGGQKAGYGNPEKIADLRELAVRESSGVTASRRNQGIFWTHNDSGDGPFIYAFELNGAKRGVWRLAGARARDWEDIAIGPGPKRGVSYLYLGDIGNNGRKPRELLIYRVTEPQVTRADAASTKLKPRLTETAEVLRLAYPEGAFDAEALMVHPVSGDLYVITKRSSEKSSIVFKAAAPLKTGAVRRLTRIAELTLSSPPFDFIAGKITGGDISPDGSRVVLCDYLQGYEFRLPEGSSRTFDTIWKQDPVRINLGTRRQGEAISYSNDGRSILATSEGSPCPLIRVSIID